MATGFLVVAVTLRTAIVLKKCIMLFALVATIVCPAMAGQTENSPANTAEPIYKVEIQRGERRTISGKKRSYTFYLPKAGPGLPGPPYPLLVMAHGFLMSGTQQSNNSEYFAERGFVVLSPNLSRILWGDKKRLHNIKDVIDQMNWTMRQNKSQKSSLYGLIDPERVGVAGNSSGGAVSLELVVQAQKANVPIHAMCSMDGAPWDRSYDSMPQLAPLKILSLRAEPSICNEHARILNFFAQLKFPFDDIKIIGAHHCDAENPTTIRCECICGRSRGQYRRMFQLFTYLFFRDTFNTPRIFEPTKSLPEVAKDFEKDGRVSVHLNQEGRAATALAAENTAKPQH